MDEKHSSFRRRGDQSQATTIQQYLNGYKAIIEDTLYGGYVRTFLKTSTAPIQINTADSLRDLIDNGVSLMTFFGHGAGIGFDYSIDYPSNYLNQGSILYWLLFHALPAIFMMNRPHRANNLCLYRTKVL